MDPYQTLGLAADASEKAIRARYLELVRQHPPDRDPERFGSIREAYDALKNPVRQLERQLFQLHSAESLSAIVAELRAPLAGKRIPVSVLLGLVEPA